MNLKEWIIHNTMGTYTDPSWPTKFLVTIWQLWKWRCSKCFNAGEDTPADKGNFLLANFDEVIHALARDEAYEAAQVRQESVELVRWETLPRGWVVLNTDGAAKGNPGPAAKGGVIRGDRGD